MKQKCKKILSVFLSIVMLLSITAGLDFSAYAKTTGNFEYEIVKDGTAKITRYKGSATDITIPSKIDGYTVTSIGFDAFYSCQKLTNVILPNSLKSIEQQAFGYCTGITSISIPNNVKSIGIDAFFRVNNVEYKGSATGSPWGAKSVNGYVDGFLVFKDSKIERLLGCSSQATNVTIPNSVKDIGDNAFAWCEKLTSVKIPDSITSIGYGVFDHCGSLLSITIPDNVRSIGEDAFNFCDSLTSVTIPNYVTDIDDYAFNHCYNLKKITIGRSVTSIGEYAINDCDNLTDVYYRGSKEQWDRISINKNAFGYDNEYLANATMHYHTTHNENKVVKKNIKRATLTDDGSYDSVVCCSLCDREMIRTKKTIPRIKSVKLGKTDFVYNGKVNKPSVTVKDAKGNTLKKGTDYTVSYAKGRKNVGKYSVKITFKGLYKGTKTLYFTIKPKATSISKLTAGSKKFTVKWYKRDKQVTGYQVQYSRNKSFSNAKTKTISKNSTTSKTVSKLSAKKKYYVRVRTYKTVNGTKYYSGWSGYKYVTTKA